MTQTQSKQLALDLLHAADETAAIAVLRKAGLWDDAKAWRLLGDAEGNYATIGNQQSKPEAALVEKIVNAVDARLLNACLAAQIDPQSAAAPQSIPEAVAQFFPGNGGSSLQDWAAAARKGEAEHITLTATGAKRNPCLTLVDRGEGQTPARVPDTFMSIGRSNKLRIPFVQGKFNMGGTGVLKFCGEDRLQLIITRRNPALLTDADRASDPTADHWSVTITRRERPTAEAGAVRNSVFTYLAPVGVDAKPNGGGVLSCSADSLPLMPKYNEPYVSEIKYGSAVKLYDYDMKGFSSNILMKDGLLFRLEALLPDIALPVNLHECRDYQGKKESSFVTPLSGLTVRLEEGKGGNLEAGFPDSQPFQVRGEKMAAKVYAFKDGKADTYRENEGVIFTINGQTHGALPKSLFNRKKVKMGRLASSLLVMVDCTGISVDAREDLFMTSRDRLSSHQLRKDIEAEIEEIIAKHPKLKQLANERRAAEISDRLADTKPLEQVLESIFKSSPSLSALFLTGQRLSSPHNRQPNGANGSNGAGGGNGNGKGTGTGTGGDGPGSVPFVGQPHPTYFRFEKMKDGEQKSRDCEFGRRCRLTFETDVENEYFRRTSNPGRFDVEVIEGSIEGREVNHSLTLHDGRAHWSIELPESVAIGESVTLQCVVADDVNPAGIVNVVKLTIRPQADHPTGDKKPRKSNTTGGGGGGEQPAGIAMPDIKKVKQGEWAKHEFDEHSSCKIVQEASEGASDVYTFYVNVDNLYLGHEMKAGGEAAELLEAKFVYGNVLIGLALIQDQLRRSKQSKDAGDASEQDDPESPEKRVEQTSRALAPFIIPMINRLGALTAEEVATFGQTGDDE